ncbi:MAG: S9 family peptidase [Prolixibacteraceae bacterium]|jgi:dipeptidyl-peptidase-4|nr:S9 family peptidase [Prolixibacteraceae bacterium]
MILRKTFLTLFIATIVLNSFSQEKKSLTLEDLTIKKTFKSESVDDVNSMNDGIHFSSLKDENSIVKYSYKTGEQVEVIFELNEVDKCPISNFSEYTFSENEERILLTTNKEKLYRHSYTAEYYVWDFYTKKLYEVSLKGPQQVATFSPDGERVAFVRDNNIFVKTIRFGTEQQVTFDGNFNEILNGIPDWVYEEEFGYNKAYVWSPDSKQLAFVKFNESEVPQISMPIYKGLSPEKIDNSLYPSYYTYKYPKAGEKNSQVSAHVYDIKTKTTIEVETGDEEEIYLPKLEWTPNGKDLAVFRLNRRQDKMEILYANPFTGDTRTIYTEKNSRFIDENFLSFFTFLSDQEHFVVASERDGWLHLYLYKNTGFKVKQLTKGEFDVTDFYGFEPKKKRFYFQAAKTSPLQRDVYAISLDEKTSINFSEKEGTNQAIFSTGFKYYLNYFSDSETPTEVTVNDKKGKIIRTLENNSELNTKLENYTLPNKEFFQFTNAENIQLNGYMIKPSSFNTNQKYPVVMYQYSGPNSQQVANKWKIDWHYFLAEQGYIVAVVDPRGTAARGEEFRKCTYMQLGKLESDDQIEAAKYLAALDYIDKDNIAIWGWSYGGFTTSLCLGKGGNLFKAGVAVAPVTNWRFYDTVYTERYMRTPQENPDGYDDNSPINNVDNLTGNLLVIHGSADDNVHAQNTFEFTEAMVQKNIPFDMHIYTNRNHSIIGGNTRTHLYNKIFNYFETHLK